ncbi:MAG: site-specific integrase [Ruminococcus sp.]|nr:site-specific integrase [Ruminococcus sp.]
MVSSKNRVKESTYIRYKNSIDNHLKPSLGKYRLSEISTKVLEEFVNEKLRYGNIISHKSLSPKTLADLLTIVKNTITYAQHEGMTIRCNFDNIRIKERNNEMRILSDYELGLLHNTLLKNPDRYKMGILLCMYTEIRIGELCSLRCGDISTEDQVMKINKTMQKLQYGKGNSERKTRIVITEPKSTSGIRTIPLQEHLIKLLALFLNNPKAYFLSGQISSIVETRVMQNKFKKYISQSGIDNINFHSLRHTFETKCVEQGFDIKSLSEILGHSSVRTTLDKYVHSSMKLKRDNM